MDNETNMNGRVTHVSAHTQGNVHMAQQSHSPLPAHTRFLVHACCVCAPLRLNEYVLNLNARSFDESCAMICFSPNFRNANYSNLDMIEKYLKKIVFVRQINCAFAPWNRVASLTLARNVIGWINVWSRWRGGSKRIWTNSKYGTQSAAHIRDVRDKNKFGISAATGKNRKNSNE